MDFFNRMWNKINGKHAPQTVPVDLSLPDDDLTAELVGASTRHTESAAELKTVIEKFKARQRSIQRGGQSVSKP